MFIIIWYFDVDTMSIDWKLYVLHIIYIYVILLQYIIYYNVIILLLFVEISEYYLYIFFWMRFKINRIYIYYTYKKISYSYTFLD